MKPSDAELSASEVSVGVSCLRKWAGQYATDDPSWGKRRAPSTEGGKALHATAEPYLRDGVYPTERNAVVELFLEGVQYLPQPKTGRVETKEIVLIRGLPFVRLLDWEGTTAVLPGDVNLLRRAVLDHKTSIDPKEYGLWTIEKHLKDPQTLIYGVDQTGRPVDTYFRHVYYRKTAAFLQWELDKYLEVGEADLELVLKYKRKIEKGYKNPWARPSDAYLTSEQIHNGLEQILPAAEKLLTIRSKGRYDPLSFPPNPTHCEDFGGCPNKEKCNLSPAEKFRGLIQGDESNMASLFDKMRVNPTPVSGPVAATAPIVAAKAEASTEQAAFPKFNFGNAAKASAPVPAAAPPAVAPESAPLAAAPAVIVSSGFPALLGRALIAAGEVLLKG